MAGVRRTLDEDLDGAHAVLREIEAAGVSYKDAVDTLETEGVEKFQPSMHELLDEMASKRDAMVGA